jgi:hydroxymethylpyrimidine/phosphomethylpyrimidine kinase
VQSDERLWRTHTVPPEVVRQQIAAALATGRVAAIKIGMLGNDATVRAVAASLPPRTELPIVLDPVLAASSGGQLLDEDGRRALLEELLLRVTLLTPNIPEAAALLESRIATGEEELLRQAGALRELGALAVLLKGGHGVGENAVDYLVRETRPPRRLCAPRSLNSRRGTGCALSSAVAAGLARGLDLEDACTLAKSHVTELLQRRA